MPHVVVEYTDNLAQDADIPGLLRGLADKLLSTDAFPAGGIRVRAHRLTEYAIADGREDDAFVHLSVKIGAGRPEAFRKAFFAEFFEIVTSHFADIAARRYLALSMYVDEVDETGSFKKNNLHARFRKPEGA